MWPTGKHGFEAVPIAESTEPPAVFGSDLQQMAYPDDYKKFTDHGRLLSEGDSHAGNVLDVQLRGEYLYAALGQGRVPRLRCRRMWMSRTFRSG